MVGRACPTKNKPRSVAVSTMRADMLDLDPGIGTGRGPEHITGGYAS